MTEKRFQIFGSVVEDILGIIPITLWQDKKQQEKFCAELNTLHEENTRLKCINRQLEERLGRSLALDMEECE